MGMQPFVQWITPIATLLLVLGGGAVIPDQPLVGWLLIAVATLLLTIPIMHYVFRQDNPFLFKWTYISMVGIIIVWAVVFFMRGDDMLFPCMKNYEARQLLRDSAGRIGDQGRKEAIECLVDNDADLTGIDLRYAQIKELDAYDAEMPNVCAPGTRFHGADFRKARLHGGFFSGSELNRADFRGAHLGSAVFGRQTICCGAMQKFRKFEGANMSEVKFDKNTDLTDAFLIGVKNLKCDQLMRGNNWEQTFRDKLDDKKCDENIPEWEGWGRRAICDQH